MSTPKVNDAVWYFPESRAVKLVEDDDGNTLTVSPDDPRPGQPAQDAHDELYLHSKGAPMVATVRKIRDDGTIDVMIGHPQGNTSSPWIRRNVPWGKPKEATEKRIHDGRTITVAHDYATAAGG